MQKKQQAFVNFLTNWGVKQNFSLHRLWLKGEKGW